MFIFFGFLTSVNVYCYSHLKKYCYMKYKSTLLFSVLAITILITSCVKQEIELDKLESEEIDPSFALPLGEATINLGRVEQSFVDDHFIYNPTTGLLEYVFPRRLFELQLADMLQFPNPSASMSFSMPAPIHTAFNLAGAGTQITFHGQDTASFSAPNGELMDSLVIKQGSLDFNLSSDFAHDVSIDIIIPSLTINGGAFNKTVTLNYSGSTPVTTTAQFDISGYKLDMTDGGVTTNTARFAFAVTLTNSGVVTSGTENIDITADFVVDTIDRAFGYFGTYTNILSADTMPIDFFENLYGGTVHVEDPRIELTVYNTSGVPVNTGFNGVYAPDNSININLAGPGLTSIPLVVGAPTINDTGITTHIIDNSNTSPTLSDIVDEGPGEMIYDASSETNPAGVTPNFVTCESKVWCDGRLVMPLYGWGNNFVFRDTTDLDLSQSLNVDSADIENIQAVTIRVVADNGLPIEASLQLYFADSNHVIIDSLFDNATGENILTAATVNFSVPVSDPNYGRVTLTGAKRKITDVMITQTRFNNLANAGVAKLIYVARGNTNDANLGRSVKFFPDYNLRIKTSAKVDMLYSLKP